MRHELKKILIIAVVFLAVYFLPIGESPAGIRFRNGLFEAFALLNEYAREHVLMCLVPAFFIAGGISVFMGKASVIKYFGAKANKWLSYSVASVSGTILAVCSCTILPLFAGIYSRGAGIGPATAFLYSGPAINVLAIILTARVLGLELGIARAIGAILFGIVTGLTMSIIFRDNQHQNNQADGFNSKDLQKPSRSLWQEIVFFGSMVGILVFANWSKPSSDNSFWMVIFNFKWFITLACVIVLAYTIMCWFKKGELTTWVKSTWEYVWLIMPMLFFGVLVAGFLLGRPDYEAIIPSSWIASLVGGNSIWANLFASAVGAFMYFATLTEVPILQGLMGAGMGKGPALALLLAGPALSLPNMLVIRQVIGTKKTVVFITLVISLSTIAGLIYGNFV